MSDRTAGHVGLVLIALAAAGLLVLEWGLAVHYLADGRRLDGAAMTTMALASSALFGWLTVDVLSSPAD